MKTISTSTPTNGVSLLLGTERSGTSNPNLCNVYQIGCGTSELYN